MGDVAIGGVRREGLDGCGAGIVGAARMGGGG